jgi:hypothetical protein
MRQSMTILPLLCLLLSAALLVHASYIAVLGGSGFFFFFDLGLLCFINIYRHVEQHALGYQSAVFLCLLGLGLFSDGATRAWLALLVYALLLFLAYRQLNAKITAALVLLCLLLLALNQQAYLLALLQHYAQYQSGDSWQQSGAL